MEQLGTGGDPEREGGLRAAGEKEEPGGTGGGVKKEGEGKPARRWVGRGEGEGEGEGPNAGRTGGKAAGSRGKDQRGSMADMGGGGRRGAMTLREKGKRRGVRTGPRGVGGGGGLDAWRSGGRRPKTGESPAGAPHGNRGSSRYRPGRPQSIPQRQQLQDPQHHQLRQRLRRHLCSLQLPAPAKRGGAEMRLPHPARGHFRFRCGDGVTERRHRWALGGRGGAFRVTPTPP